MKVLILGGSGQTGSYLSELYVASGHNVVNASRRPSSYSQSGTQFLQIDVDESFDLNRLLQSVAPDLVINLLSLSSVMECERNPNLSEGLNWSFVEKCLHEVNRARDYFGKEIRFVQASSSEMFSAYPAETVINESSKLHPATTYGKHKARAHEAILNFNMKFGGTQAAILFNHESPRRTSKFVSKKIINGLIDIKKGKSNQIVLGNIASRRDWGFAADYAAGIMALAENSKQPALVFASGELHSVEEFLKHAAATIGVQNILDKILIDPNLIRKVENDGLIGDSTRAHNYGWSRSLNFYELIEYMANHEMAIRDNDQGK